MVTVYGDLPFEHARGDGGVRSQTQMVVIHATDNTASASDEASYASTRSDMTSAHFYADDGSVIQAVPTDHIAYGCYPTGNYRSIQFELVGKDWPDSQEISDATLRRVAPVVFRVCNDWGIPIRKIGPDELRNGVKGICGHVDVTNAWHEGDHQDPGPAFPWDRFITLIQGDTVSDNDIPDTHRLAGNGDTWGRALVTGESPAHFLGGVGTGVASTTPNVLHSKLDAIKAAVTAPAPVALTDAQLATVAAQVTAELGAKLDAILAKLTAEGKALDS